MKFLYSILVFVVATVVTGCTTSSQVQEMISASNQDVSEVIAAHESSINLLDKSTATNGAVGQENADAVVALQAKLAAALQRIENIQGYADASKLLSAANTVKVADLETTIQENQEVLDETILRLAELDKRYETVMVQHYKDLIDGATSAIESLQIDHDLGRSPVPINLDEPIEIVAPDTSVPEINTPVEE